MPGLGGSTLFVRTLIAAALVVAIGCKGNAPNTAVPATTAPSTPTVSSAPSAHPLVLALANEGTGSGSAQDIARAEAWLADVAVENGVEVAYYLDVWDGTDLYSPFSPTLEAVRRILAGAELCPLEAPVGNAAVAGSGQAVIQHASDYGRPFGSARLKESRAIHDAVEHLKSGVATGVEEQFAVGDASTSVSLRPYEAPAAPTVEFPAEWLASSASAIALVVCLRTEQTDEIVKTCSYSNDVTVETLRMATTAEIYDAQTAELVDTVTVTGLGDDGKECPLSIRAEPGTHRNDGPFPTADSIVDALAPIFNENR